MNNNELKYNYTSSRKKNLTIRVRFLLYYYYYFFVVKILFIFLNKKP